jgi:hypothetical protein
MVERLPLIRGAARSLVAALCLALAGCGTDSDYEQMGKLVWQSVSTIGSEQPGVPRAQAAAIPYASLGIRYASGREGLLVLATVSGTDREWLGGTQVSLVTRDGRIIRTVGLPRNLTGFQGPFADTGPDAVPGGYHYLYDFADRHVYGVVVDCVQRDAGAEQVDIIGASHETRHIVETCTAPRIDWDFENEFWRDAATGYVWRSIQSIHPAGDPVTTEILRPEE